MKEIEFKVPSPDSMRVRCPYCRKLYMVQFSDVVEAKPRFECVDCRTKFWLSLPDMDLSSELVGLPIEMKRAPAVAGKVVAKTPCPKCFTPLAEGVTECGNCGVVLNKIKELDFLDGRVVPPRSESLALAWKTVVSNYGEEGVHNNFLRLASKEGHLAFAAFQYAQMRKLMPNDEMTLLRLRAIDTMALEIAPRRERQPVATSYSRLWQIPLFAATVLILVGAAFPTFRNLASLGGAFLFAAVMMRIQSRPR